MSGPASKARDANQAWWESLSRSGGRRNDGRRSAGRRGGRSSGLRLYAMTCGWLSSRLDMMLAGREGSIRFPVPAYLIEHPRGRVLFDTGIHPEAMHDARGRLGNLVDHFQVHFRPGEDIGSRLAQLGVDSAEIDYVINSHLHFDHAGGNVLVPNARIIVQEREWEAGKVPELIESNGYLPGDYEHGHLVRRVNGEFDLFGDGSVVTVPTFGHTPGHQSLKLKLSGGEVVLAADACYFRESLRNLHLPRLVHDRARMLESLLLLRKLERQGARIFYGHDPEFWREVPQAPLTVV